MSEQVPGKGRPIDDGDRYEHSDPTGYVETVSAAKLLQSGVTESPEDRGCRGSCEVACNMVQNLYQNKGDTDPGAP